MRFVILLLVLLTALPSCKKCETCTLANMPDVKVCTSDYSGNKLQYELTLEDYEANGYSCAK